MTARQPQLSLLVHFMINQQNITQHDDDEGTQVDCFSHV